MLNVTVRECAVGGVDPPRRARVCIVPRGASERLTAVKHLAWAPS